MAFLGHYAEAQCAAYGYFTQSAASAVFYDSSYSVNGHEAYWSFGDSTSGSYGTQVSHTYTANGTYSACLFIYDTIANCNDT
ncbi:MAG: PKD repeat protein, partial [Bacteroidia bacterium]